MGDVSGVAFPPAKSRVHVSGVRAQKLNLASHYDRLKAQPSSGGLWDQAGPEDPADGFGASRQASAPFLHSGAKSKEMPCRREPSSLPSSNFPSIDERGSS